jgi:hypothetical protein
VWFVTASACRVWRVGYRGELVVLVVVLAGGRVGECVQGVPVFGQEREQPVLAGG